MPTRSFGFSSVGPEVGRSVPAGRAGDQVRQRRLAQPGRTGEQHVFERFAAARGRVDRDAQVVDDLLLPDVVLEGARAQRRAVDFVFERGVGADYAWMLVRHIRRRLAETDRPFADRVAHAGVPEAACAELAEARWR